MSDPLCLDAMPRSLVARAGRAVASFLGRRTLQVQFVATQFKSAQAVEEDVNMRRIVTIKEIDAADLGDEVFHAERTGFKQRTCHSRRRSCRQFIGVWSSADLNLRIIVRSLMSLCRVCRAGDQVLPPGGARGADATVGTRTAHSLLRQTSPMNSPSCASLADTSDSPACPRSSPS